ncbi:hydrolase [Actinoplanes sp. SE50]|uniref:alpha/beta fold hydrolase n=1 Tax=unclassified Actinoplanes TaxID=2626549 RepID=UPI00023EBB93|nr:MULTISPECIES: alpha/beta hydrolase [unclassified Actinoplanes]AEV84500.1 Epoxide hydrolase 2 [Actinoplanes sp. SE50/110]ATO82892.1 hydrolase [Actinoplanes sp. SE50]SLM00300.1 hydrolase [Actinoplanes sp. SE50/110]
MTTQYAINGGVRIAVEELGGAGGAPLLLVMGLGTSRFWWPDGLVTELVRRGFHVAAYDQRDAGQSTRLPAVRRTGPPIAALVRRSTPAYTAEDLTDDAVAVLDTLGWHRAHLFGHSMGGLVAQRIAIRHPGRVLTMTSSAAIPSDVRGLRTLRHLRLAPLVRFARLHHPATPDGDLRLAVAIARILAAPGQDMTERDVREFVTREAAHHVASFRDDEAQSRQTGATWSGGPLHRITAPTLVLHGERDPIVRVGAARAIAAAVPGARLRIIPGAGHFLSRDLWNVYAEEIHAIGGPSACG